MIEKVSFRNFKAYRSLDLELEPFTVVVGPNASGKTTLFEGLDLFLGLLCRASTQRFRSGLGTVGEAFVRYRGPHS